MLLFVGFNNAKSQLLKIFIGKAGSIHNSAKAIT